MGERAFIIRSFLRGNMKQLRTSNTNAQQRHTPGVTAILACAIALTLAGCGQMGDLYQPMPEPTEAQQPTDAPSSVEDETDPGRGD